MTGDAVIRYDAARLMDGKVRLFYRGKNTGVMSRWLPQDRSATELDVGSAEFSEAVRSAAFFGHIDAVAGSTAPGGGG